MTVYLVGAGPGDPGLLTVRAREVLARADVVVYDRLIEPAVLAIAPRDAVQIDVGKRPGASERSAQDSINALLVSHGSTGKCVVRLKGGDPYLFGRGGEEARALEAAAIEYQVVPGLSSIIVVPSAAGVPLTMRGLSSSVLVVTGHDADRESSESSIDWEANASSDATLVVLMGGATRAAIAKRLIGAGRSPETPVLVVIDGTTSRQRSMRLTLASLGDADVEGPATLVIGTVAALEFASYEHRPLHGLRVVVTRPAADGPRFAHLLTEHGAEPVAVPMIAITAAGDGGRSLREALARLADFEWIVLASSHGVAALFRELHDARDLAGVRLGAIGESTARALGAQGIVADLVPSRFLVEGLLAEFPAPGRLSGRVLLPSADRAGPELAAGLTERGWQVERVEAYRTVHPNVDEQMLALLAGADVITFTSASTVEGFLALAGRVEPPPIVATIGPVTSKAARAAGISVDVEADVHTVEGLLDALARHVALHPIVRGR